MSQLGHTSIWPYMGKRKTQLTFFWPEAPTSAHKMLAKKKLKRVAADAAIR